MMKKTTFLAGMAFFSFSSVAYAQTGRLGINTTTPASTLDISGQRDTNGNLLTTDITGLQAPRLTLTELSAKPSSIYGTNQKGALVYITSAAPAEITSAAAAANSTQTSNIAAAGYYYFDGTKWLGVSSGITTEVDGVIGNEVTDATANGGLIKSGAGTTADPYTLGLTAGTTAGQTYVWDGNTWAPGSAVNIYDNDGTLAANRTVTQGANTLSFTATSTNAFSVDGTTFSVDATNDRVGLGTNAPSTRLHINNATAGAIRIVDTTQGLGKVLTSDANGVGTWAATDGIVGNEVTAAANTSLTRTGTGTAADPYKLKIMDGTAANQVLTWDGTKWTAVLPSSDWKLAGNTATNAATNFLGTTDAVDFVAKTNNTERLRIKSAGNVGIGTSTPTGVLDIYGLGGTSGARFLSGTNGDTSLRFYGMAAGSFSRISAAGPLAFYSMGRNVAGNTSDLMINNGKVGIGTDSPSVKLDINYPLAGAVKIVDGTQGLSKVLTSDANGLATWKYPLSVPEASYGVKDGASTNALLDNTWKYTNWYIDLPANTTYYINWTFQVGKNGGSADGWLHILSRFSVSKTTIDTTGLQLLSNAQTFGTLTTSWGDAVPNYFGQIRGSHAIKNTTAATIRLYLLATVNNGTNYGTPNAYNGYGENAIVAIEIN